MTKRTVYLINERLRGVGEALEERGFEVLLGNGELNREYLSRCWAFLPGRTHVTREVLDMAPKLKLICKQGVGVERIDTKACAERGITVRSTPGSNAVSVAEHTMALMLACIKRLRPIAEAICGDGFDLSCVSRFRASELAGKTLSVIGFGDIGSRVARMASAFDMHILAYVRHPERCPAPEYVELTANLDEAMSRADIVTLHVSGTAENRHMIGARELSLMRPNAVLINTTRGFVVDEEALYDALTNGRLGGAGLDVFAADPVAPDDPLLKLSNVVATPHTAANTPESNQRAYEMCVQIVTEFAQRE